MHSFDMKTIVTIYVLVSYTCSAMLTNVLQQETRQYDVVGRWGGL